MTLSTSSVRKSRTVRSMRSGSSKRQAGAWRCLAAFLDSVPLFEEEGEVADEEAGALALPSGAHDDAHAVGQVERAEDFAQAVALLGIFDLLADAALVAVGHEDQEAAREREVGGDARALGADRDPW